MEIIHRVGQNTTPLAQQAFAAAGFEVPLGVAAFEVGEDDPRWPAVRTLISRFDCLDIVHTAFTTREIQSSNHLVVDPTWHLGYPQPEDDFLRETYDLSDYCEKCGVGLRQIAPFRLSKIPVWGRNSIFQLNWIFDEYFVKPEVWKAVFSPLGVGCRPVVLHRKNAEIDSVVQLDLPELVHLEFGEAPFELCSTCGRKRYQFIKVGYMPRPVNPVGSAFKSREYVGSGFSASRLVVFSQELYRSFASRGLRGVSFSPCAPSDGAKL